tara:strand:- start:43 stop:213 length:171 start_codon:yes stop_codon:yes gene_type:complete
MKLSKVKKGNTKKLEYPLSIHDEKGKVIAVVSVKGGVPVRIINQLRQILEQGIKAI